MNKIAVKKTAVNLTEQTFSSNQRAEEVEKSVRPGL